MKPQSPHDTLVKRAPRVTTVQSEVAREASAFSFALAARMPCPLGGHPGTANRMLLFQKQRNKLLLAFP